MAKEDREEKAILLDIEELLFEILQVLKSEAPPAATSLNVFQIIGGNIMAILGIQKGAVGQFTGVPFPAGSSLQAGSVPTWSADDPNVTLTPSADGSAVAVQTSATDTASSFNLTQNAVSSSGASITSGPVNVPLLSAAVVPATAMTVNQTS
jgi:hypothetical protein